MATSKMPKIFPGNLWLKVIDEHRNIIYDNQIKHFDATRLQTIMYLDDRIVHVNTSLRMFKQLENVLVTRNTTYLYYKNGWTCELTRE